MSLNPVITSQKIFQRFSSYIQTSLKLKDESLNLQIKQILEEKSRFSKGPIIEATPPFEAGRSLDSFIAEGLLCPGFNKLQTSSLPMQRPLYKHQDEAVVKLCGQKRNAVVATGTGSGKTESFMIPILDHLLKQQEAGKLTPGVRALLLYPMNALANDQMKRLRQLLTNRREITFGIYTGETEEKYQAAHDKYQRMHQQKPLINELICREQMKNEPPHILLTNYAMLEYLMLRPADNVFFQGDHATGWKFIVIDEAHTYTGAKGIEMSMLIARLKTIIGIPQGHITCIMTSASLGKGKEDFPQVADFASKLFGEPFDATDIIEATKKSDVVSTTWGAFEESFYAEAAHWLDQEPKDQQALETLMKHYGVPKDLLETEKRKGADSTVLLYSVLSGDLHVVNTIKRLAKGPVLLGDLADELFPGNAEATRHTASLIDLCNRVRRFENDHPLLPARYHYMVKALEGAFIILADKPKIFLDRTNRTYQGNVPYKAFEMGSCNKCNSLYLVGEVVPGEEGKPFQYLRETRNRYLDSDSQLEYFALLDQDTSQAEEDEDALLEATTIKVPRFQDYKLCVHCGAIGPDDDQPVCYCLRPATKRLLKVNTKGRKVHKCGVCGGVNTSGNIVRRFYLSEDAVSSVLATALYQELPQKVKSLSSGTEEADNDIFGFLDEDNIQSTHLIKSSKQLLVFSDSRQNAAYFAPYLSRTYDDLLIKNAMVKTMGNHLEECLNNQWTLTDYYHRLAGHVKQTGLMTASVETLKRDLWKWIMREFAVDMGTHSLEGMGLIHFKPNFEMVPGIETLWRIPFLKQAGFEEDELPVLYHYLLDQFRTNRAVAYPEETPPRDPFFEPQNQQGGFWRQKPEGEIPMPGGYAIKGWVPASMKYSNSRMDYLTKVLAKSGMNWEPMAINKLLGDLFTSLVDHRSPMADWVKNEQISGAGKIFKLDPKVYSVSPGSLDPAVAYYQCNTCYKITPINLRSVCPTYRCEGSLLPVDLGEKLKDDHYRHLYCNLRPETMKTSEHTAQLTTEYAAEVQTKFINGDVNVLSCSTTFELGVDVGELETVFMKNMPPTPANYAQRAGRAGRRVESTAFALTYARLASHDFSSFREPEKMISGVVKPPYFEVANEKIVLRHMYACAFALFWRTYPDYFKSVKDFFRQEPTGPILFREFLASRPKALVDMLEEIVPEGLHGMTHLSNWQWVERLYGETGVMTKVTSELDNDLNNLQTAIETAVANNKYSYAGLLDRVRNTILKRPLIMYLSQKNLLPKYGFPVDVVSMEINSHTDEAKSIDLTRDLQIAISEYAPEGQVVANGKLWTSRYVKRVANRELLRYKYIQCKCGYFRKSIDLMEEFPASCPVCEKSKPRVGTFILPEFGFISEPKPNNPGDRKPEKTYSGRKHFSRSGNQMEEKNVVVGSSAISLSTQAHGVLTVINNGLGGGFYLCRFCGYGSKDTIPKSHNNPQQQPCSGSFERVSIGYDFETDILEMNLHHSFAQKTQPEGYWESLMYAIIEGMSSSLEIDRNDIDGTLYINQDYTRSIILFDTVPGGAGHVKRMLKDNNLKIALTEALQLVSHCTCGAETKDTSCYSCLRNYYNQYCHESLRRDYAIEALSLLVGQR